MIQILGYRESKDANNNDEIVFKQEYFGEVESLPYLFRNIDSIVSEIKESERYNLHYTIASCTPRSKQFVCQDIIPFDFDDMDNSRIDEYIEVFFKTLPELDRNKTAIVSSGNGLHFLVHTHDSWDDPNYFKEARIYYKGICGKLIDACYEAGLMVTLDSNVFRQTATMRLPNTLNVKPEGTTKCVLLQSNLELQVFDLRVASGMPAVNHDQQIHENVVKRFGAPDAEGIMEGCDFLKFCRDHQESISEPQWYAMLSIVGRFENGREVAHAMSAMHPKYSERQTDRKLEQALHSSGPRTCDNISSMWDGCMSCSNYGKCKSPILIRGESYIKTKETGFYNTYVCDKTGEIKKGKPNYADLMKYFASKNKFKASAEGGMLYVYREDHWQDLPISYVNAFAEDHFDPEPSTAMCTEFRNKLLRNNVTDLSWFDVENHLNFANGVLNVNTMQFYDNSPKYGFRYILPFPYDPMAQCPTFSKVLNKLTCGNTLMQTLLLEYMGYCLSGIDPAIGSKCMILTGEGSNGKSVFLDVLKYMAGERNYSAMSMGSEIAKLENRYQLEGKLFNVSEETPDKAMVDSSLFKAIVTGGTVSARKLYCDAYELKVRSKLIMACNRLPPTTDDSHGFMRRLLIVPFNATFKETDADYDPYIREKLYAEASGIFNLVLDAYSGFLSRKRFTSLKLVDEMVEAYRIDNDPVHLWADSALIPSASGVISYKTLYTAYQMEHMGERIVPRAAFSRKITNIFSKEATKKMRAEGLVQRCLLGYRLATKEDDGELNEPNRT